MRQAAYWFRCAARYALVAKAPKPVATVLDSARAPVYGERVL